MLAGDDPLALVTVSLCAGVVGQHRALGLLGLQQQRLAVVAAVPSAGSSPGADAADADDLAGDVGEGELLEQVAPVGLQGRRYRAKRPRSNP